MYRRRPSSVSVNPSAAALPTWRSRYSRICGKLAKYASRISCASSAAMSSLDASPNAFMP
jgi:hypothetical protein